MAPNQLIPLPSGTLIHRGRDKSSLTYNMPWGSWSSLGPHSAWFTLQDQREKKVTQKLTGLHLCAALQERAEQSGGRWRGAVGRRAGQSSEL